MHEDQSPPGPEKDPLARAKLDICRIATFLATRINEQYLKTFYKFPTLTASEYRLA